ncbi:MAG: dethiobiotin synthase [Candidatus Thiothrix singaporensis]|uniref:ATP-dependent dethiobiotin synthetase BioD n=1 Tax=Candidatus Thiothrix singaporensis TaxID=2799669 RepID=A0A7L6AWQ8_9GAMM|nr:MAG: dethiobiotin synthase [Candidatus Thiothrix singaporensis]
MGMIISTLAHWLEHSGIGNAQGVFVTGTDTGVGKTRIGVQLIQILRVLGREVIPRKPVESGWAEDVSQTDAWQLANAAGLPVGVSGSIPVLDSVCPNHFKAAISPPRAAALEGKTLKMLDIAATCPTRLKDNQYLYVEGAGGFYSPITHDGLNADLAQTLGLPVVVVAEDKLGCLNHTLLVADAVRQKGLRLAGVILNTRHPTPEGMDNLSDLRTHLNAPTLRYPFH